jgi:23S rRNA (uridine2552-2'-O)-methyltransferase
VTRLARQSVSLSDVHYFFDAAVIRGKRARIWHRQHSNDPFVRQAREQGWRSRAVYKLQEIDLRDRLFRSGMTVVDLGAAPGGWSQYAMAQIGDRGRIIALDISPMEPLERVEFLQVDVSKKEALRLLMKHLNGARADLVMSDMAPNITGMAVIDQPRSMVLAELGLQLASEILKPGGDFVFKLFQGAGFDEYVRAARASFAKATLRKPKASRAHSREVYLVAKNYRM